MVVYQADESFINIILDNGYKLRKKVKKNQSPCNI